MDIETKILIFRELTIVPGSARERSRALVETHQLHHQTLKIKVTGQVKVRLKVKMRYLHVVSR